jgi:hypothetical protein
MQKSNTDYQKGRALQTLKRIIAAQVICRAEHAAVGPADVSGRSTAEGVPVTRFAVGLSIAANLHGRAGPGRLAEKSLARAAGIMYKGRLMLGPPPCGGRLSKCFWATSS